MKQSAGQCLVMVDLRNYQESAYCNTGMFIESLSVRFNATSHCCRRTSFVGKLCRETLGCLSPFPFVCPHMMQELGMITEHLEQENAGKGTGRSLVWYVVLQARLSQKEENQARDYLAITHWCLLIQKKALDNLL